MKTDAVIRLMSLLAVCVCFVQSQTPELTPADLQGKVTTNSVILKQPHCYFNNTCPSCEIWLVPSLSSATSTFDADRTNSNILSLSPYPSAFNTAASKNYFLTRVGPLSSFPCNASSDALYFVVGADGNCGTVNCNGALPTGSTVGFKYLLVNGSSIINTTNWSNSITLFTPQNYQNISVAFAGRSAAMVVITAILCGVVGLLLLLFFIMLCVVCCRTNDSKQITGNSSMRIPRYDTHNLHDRMHPYDNPAYEMERHTVPGKTHTIRPVQNKKK